VVKRAIRAITRHSLRQSARVDDAFQALAVPFPLPDEDADEVTWEAWVSFTEMESTIAGHLSGLRSGEGPSTVMRSDLDGWRRSLLQNERWRNGWPERADALIHACDLLGNDSP
jgi:hypothetical protein